MSVCCPLKWWRYRIPVSSKQLSFKMVAFSNTCILIITQLKKQPPKVFYKKRFSEKFHKIHRETPAPESLFKAQRPTLLKRDFNTGVLPLNFANFLRRHFLTEHIQEIASVTYICNIQLAWWVSPAMWNHLDWILKAWVIEQKNC